LWFDAEDGLAVSKPAALANRILSRSR
jgi:hypothetical protein